MLGTRILLLTTAVAAGFLVSDSGCTPVAWLPSSTGAEAEVTKERSPRSVSIADAWQRSLDEDVDVDQVRRLAAVLPLLPMSGKRSGRSRSFPSRFVSRERGSEGNGGSGGVLASV